MRPTILVCLEIAAVLAAAPIVLGCASGPTARATAPVLAFAATDNDIAPGGCAIGSPSVLATSAAPPVGLSARAGSQVVWIAFAPTMQERATLSVDPTSLRILGSVQGSAPGGENDRDVDPSSMGQRNSVFVWLAGGRSIQAWTEGSTETKFNVRVRTLDRAGEPLDSPVSVQHEGSAFGAPALAMNSSGHGLLAFIESNGRGFQLVAAPLDCSIHE